MRITKRLVAMLALATAVVAVVATTAGANTAHKAQTAKVTAAADDDAVVLPSRVGNAITRGQNLLEAAGTSIDSGSPAQAATQINNVVLAVRRVDEAARAQMNAPADPNSETTPGPDSVVAALTFEQGAVTMLAGYFDGKSGTTVDALTHSLFSTLNSRDKLLNAVIALPAEGAGADYSDGMADTVAGYDDEVANLKEALANDTLSAGGKKVITSALAQSTKTDAAANAAFGGGE
jgi:hypothetical protein